MCRVSKNVFTVALIVIISFVCTSCMNSETPDANTAEIFIKDNHDDIQVVTDYLLNEDYYFAYIKAPNGQIYANFEYMAIDDSQVNDSIKSLWNAGCKRISRITDDNAIDFLLECNIIKEIDYGFVCPIDDSFDFKIDYQTELVPLTFDNWYFYVSDYNKWRLSQNSSETEITSLTDIADL